MKPYFILFALIFLSATEEKLPVSIQKGKELFDVKCSSCHSIFISKYLDCIYPSFIHHAIHAATERPGANISKEDAQLIYQYLVYDAYYNRKARLDRELSELPETKQEEEKKALEQIIHTK